ncbi:hypothetical protein GCM10027448_23740 [Nocardioides dilutus]
MTLLVGLGTAAATTSSAAQTKTQTTTAAKATKYVVTARVSSTEPEQGDKIKIRGSVTPFQPGAKVLLQKRYGTTGKWKKADTDTLNNRGKFKFTDKMGSVRFRQYRVVKPADAHAKSGKSQKLGVTVFGWRYLTSLTPVAATGTGETSSVTINATAYEQSLVGNGTDNSGSIAYNVNRACKRFEGRVGLSDSSALTATGQVTLMGDTSTLYTNSFGLTQSAPVGLDLAGVFRITVDWTSSNTEGTPDNQSGAVIAVGSPRLLCSF